MIRARQWWATVVNEFLQLIRDRVGLILLFIMPAALVLVVTLVQDPLLKQEGSGFRLKGLVVDEDGGRAAQLVLQAMTANAAVSIAETMYGKPWTAAAARKAVDRGDYQFYLAIPPGLSQRLDEHLGREAESLLSGRTSDLAAVAIPDLTVCYDPAIRSSYRAAIAGAVQQAAAAMETALGLQQMALALNRRMGAVSALPPAGGGAAPVLALESLMERRVAIRETTSGPDPFSHLPTSVQQNVPAWSLFGMFFIVVPLSAALIRERREGIVDRLKTMPVALSVVLLGKLTVYTGVCMVQFICIVLVGKWILPLLGTDVLILGPSLPLVALIALCSSLAATGYGILLGGLARTHEQATVIGPVSVVIAAALGGIMVPVFAMPAAMQTLSRLSPLAWAHSAFMALLVRSGSWSAIAGRIGLLLLFFIVTVLIGGMAVSKRQ